MDALPIAEQSTHDHWSAPTEVVHQVG
jgi:hypothetical protein